MKTVDKMKSVLLAQDPTYTQEELDGMTDEQVVRAYNDLMESFQIANHDDWDWRKLHVVQNNL